MEFIDLLKKNRSYRRFDENTPISEDTIRELISNTRYTASARNLQPILFVPVVAKELCNAIFPALTWAGYLRDWEGPALGERPTAYIILVKKRSLVHETGIDEGILLQTLLLSAVEKGLGGCIITACNRSLLRKELCIDEKYDIICTLALGKPTETIQIVDLVDDEHEYYRDEQDIHYVPKRSVEEAILNYKTKSVSE